MYRKEPGKRLETEERHKPGVEKKRLFKNIRNKSNFPSHSKYFESQVCL